jgi:cyclopropane-fatty-acyl-phospholipid synthase
VTERLDFGSHYATTLRHWRQKFLANWSTIEGTQFDSAFKRMWEFYLGYCEAGFAAGYLGVSQFSLSRSRIAGGDAARRC